MRGNFDGVRKRLLVDFNRMARTCDRLDFEQRNILADIRDEVASLICMFDDSCVDDCNDLSDLYVETIPE